jgi:hypothetical protein
MIMEQGRLDTGRKATEEWTDEPRIKIKRMLKTVRHR